MQHAREARTSFPNWCRRTGGYEDVVSANKGVPVVRLVKVGAQDSARKPGAWSGLPKAKADWDTPATNSAIADAVTGGKWP